MYDTHNRLIDYLRISVTDRCNFRCLYCMPQEGVRHLSHSEILQYEEILRIVNIVSRHGIKKIRLTGGEPLVRKGITGFIHDIARNANIKDISLTTNGSLLASMAEDLKKAGLNRVNISLDTLNSEQFRIVTGGGILSETLRGIESALTVGLTPVKINVVLTNFFTEDSLRCFLDKVYKYPLIIRFIEYMPIGNCGANEGMNVETVKNILIEEGGCLQPVFSEKNGPAKYYRLKNTKGKFGFITPITEHFCDSCNRIRLTADGKLKPCLLSNQEIDIKTPLRAGVSDEVLAELFRKAVVEKPERHNLCRLSGHPEFNRKMSQIGG